MDKKLASTTYDCKTAAAILGVSMTEMRRLSVAHGIEKYAEARGPQHSPRYLPRQIIELRKCLSLLAPTGHCPLYLSDGDVKKPEAVSRIVHRRGLVFKEEWGKRSPGWLCEACTLRCALGSIRIRDVSSTAGVYFPSRYEDVLMLCLPCAADYEAWAASRRLDGKELEVRE